MLDWSLLRDTAVVALAGRRIGAVDINPSRFPLEVVPIVRRRRTNLLPRKRAVALVCSAACGADLLALEEAERLGLRRRIIPRFRRTDTKRPRLLTAQEIGVECSTVSSRLRQRPATSLCFLEMLAATRPRMPLRTKRSLARLRGLRKRGSRIGWSRRLSGSD
jgi:hypothetical protein